MATFESKEAEAVRRGLGSGGRDSGPVLVAHAAKADAVADAVVAFVGAALAFEDSFVIAVACGLTISSLTYSNRSPTWIPLWRQIFASDVCADSPATNVRALFWIAFSP